MTGRYLLFAGLAYLIFWKWLPKRLQNYRIQQVWPKAEKLAGVSVLYANLFHLCCYWYRRLYGDQSRLHQDLSQY